LPHSWCRLAGSRGSGVVVVALTQILLGSQKKEKDDESTHMTMPLLHAFKCKIFGVIVLELSENSTQCVVKA